MPSFYGHPSFLLHSVGLPLGILAVCYMGYAIVRNRFDLKLESLSQDWDASFDRVLPDVLEIFVRASSVATFVGIFTYTFFITAPEDAKKLLPAYEKILAQTVQTSAIDRFYVPSKGAQVEWEGETSTALSMTYWMLGLQRYRIAVPDAPTIHALLPIELDTAQAENQILSEPLLLTPVSGNYFTPQGLKRAQENSRTVSARQMVEVTNQHTAPFLSLVTATRRLGLIFIPLVLFGALLRFAQVWALRRAVESNALAGPTARLQIPYMYLPWLFLTRVLGVSLSRVKTSTGRFVLAAAPYSVASGFPLSGRLVTLGGLPEIPMPAQLGLLAAGIVAPLWGVWMALFCASLFQTVFIPEALLVRVQRRMDQKSEAS